MPKSVAVTGATGFIGHVILCKLVENGWTIRALTRCPRINNESIQWIQGDLDDLNALHELVKNVSAVVHCAGVVKGRTLDEFVHTNVEGTKNLVLAITEQKLKPRFLLISSLAARQPELSWYAKSKFMAEQYLATHYDDTLHAAFRPTAVYGPGDQELKPIFQATRRGILPVVGNLTNRFGLLHVNDLVAAILQWLSTAIPVTGTFELDDGTSGGYSYHSLAAIAQEVWGHPVHCITIPIFLIKCIATLNLRLAQLFHYAPMLTPEKIKELQHKDWVCDNTPLIRALPSWRPSIRLHDSLSQVI
mgnify:CR=1 FL=1